MPGHHKKTDKRVAIGVEITGSRATIVQVDRQGKIHHRFYAKTLRGRPAVATLEPYFRALETALLYAKSERLLISGIGVCIPGILDITARRPHTRRRIRSHPGHRLRARSRPREHDGRIGATRA